MASPLRTTVTASGHWGGEGVPSQLDNQQDFGQVDPIREAIDIGKFHQQGLRRRRYHDLTCEKYMIHIDGEGENQYADLYNGERIEIPYNLSGAARSQNNLLRPMVDNMVAYHTTMQFRFVVDCRPDREARERAAIEQAFANYIAQRQHMNAIYAEGMYMAAAFGHTPLHSFWRDDINYDPYEPVHQPTLVEGEQPMQGPRRGALDMFVGDPFDTIYGVGATRGSIERMTYGRVLGAGLVRQAYPHVKGIEGSTQLSSSSRFQRTVRKWLQSSTSLHGTAAVMSGHSDEELIALIYREIAPGIDQLYPAGRLTIIALNGSATTDESDAGGGATSSYGSPLWLHDGPLPGGCFSNVQLYSANRFDDVLGKPFVADLDEDQIQLNQLETLVNEFVRRSVRAPLVTAGVLADDTAAYMDDGELEVDPGSAFMPHYLELPYRHISLLENKINRLETGMFRKGGWQAASRGESRSGDSGAKVVALARADDTVHGPTNQRFRETAEAHMVINWKLAKQYMDVPWLMDIAGDELNHLVEPYVDRTQFGEEPPVFRLTSGFGATTEAKGQQLMELWGMVDPQTGERVLTTKQFKKLWPDKGAWPDEMDPQEMRERRPKVINQGIRTAARQVREEYGLDPSQVRGMSHPVVLQAAQYIWGQIDQEYPLMMDDDAEVNIEALSTMTQDESEDPISRRVAMFRMDQFFAWLSGQQEAVAQSQAAAAQAAKVPPPTSVGGIVGGPRQEVSIHGGTQTAEAMNTSTQEVAALTREAQGSAA